VTKYALINSFGTIAYVVAIVLMVTFLGSIADEKDTLLAPILALLLFVFSAAFTGFLVLGKPIMWYLDGKKKEALSLFGYTMFILLIILSMAFAFLIFS